MARLQASFGGPGRRTSIARADPASLRRPNARRRWPSAHIRRVRATSRRSTAGCARRFSETVTGSCTARRFGGSSTRHRCSSRHAGRPLPDASDPHARGHPGLPHRRPGAGAQRGPDRGDRARPTISVISPFGHVGEAALDRVSAGTVREPAFATTSSRCGWSIHLERDGRGLNLTEPCPRRDRPATRADRRQPVTLEGRIVRHRRSGGLTSITTSTTPFAPACWTTGRPARPSAIAILGETGERRIDATRTRSRRAVRAGRRHRPG